MAIKYGSQVWGSVNLNVLNTPIIINNTNNTLVFQVDGSEYSISIPEGSYLGNINHFTQPIIQAINTGLSNATAPMKAKLGGIHIVNHINVLILEHTDLNNNHAINNFSGNALSTVFGDIRFSYPPKTISL